MLLVPTEFSTDRFLRISKADPLGPALPTSVHETPVAHESLSVFDRSFAVVILAGGKSRRMGEDKATLVYEGQTLLARIVEQSILAQASHVVVVGGDPAWVDQFADEPRVGWVADRWPGEGPLGGIVTGFAAERLWGLNGPRVVLSCDLPLVRAEVISWLANRWFEVVASSDQSDETAFVADLDGVDQPLCAAYSPACGLRADALFRSGQRSLGSLLSQIYVRREVAGKFSRSLEDVDTPADWERARNL